MVRTLISDFVFLWLQLAIMSGHFELGEIIKNHKDSDIGKLSVQTLCLIFPYLSRISSFTIRAKQFFLFS